jgi:hypothetical protein
MKNLSAGELVFEMRLERTGLAWKKKTLERAAPCLAEALSCINIYEPSNNTRYFYAG